MNNEETKDELGIRLTPDEQDARLMKTVERMRAERLATEQQNAQLRLLVNHYSMAVEQLEAELAAVSSNESDRKSLKDLLHRLSERSASVAASL